MNKKKLTITLGIIYLCILALLYVYAYVIPDISGMLTSTYIVQAETYQTVYNAECIVVRDEKIYEANASGNIHYYIEESEKTRIGTRVIDIYSSTNQKESRFCECTGFISYYHDGYETLLTPTSVIDMDPSSYFSFAESTENTKRNDNSTVVKGEFVYKIVDGSAWYLLIPVTEDDLSLFKMGSNLNIMLSDGTSFTAEAQRVLGENTLAIMAKVTSYYPDFAKYRWMDVNIITKETSGLVIPKTAVSTNENGNEGVFVLGTDGEYHFTRIYTLEDMGDSILIQADEFSEKQEDGTARIISSVEQYDEIKRDADE